MSEIVQHLPTASPRQSRTWRILALVFLIVLALVFLHWLFFQGYVYVPGIIV